MPALVRKLAIFAAGDGLVLKPLHPRTQSQRSLKIEYGSHTISTTTVIEVNDNASIECHGVVGFLNVDPVSYLIVITKRQQVAQIQGNPIYVISDVSLIPLSGQDEATKSLQQTKATLKKAPTGTDGVLSDSEVSEDEEEDQTEHDDDGNSEVSPVSAELPPADDSALEKRPDGPNRSTSNVAEDVIEKKGQYGRFADRWFSKKGWTSDKRRALGMSADDNLKSAPPIARTDVESAEQPSTVAATDEKAPSTNEALDGDAADQSDVVSSEPKSKQEPQPKDTIVPANMTNTLLPKLLRTTRMLLASKSFFFSYDMDITRRLGTQPRKASDLPLHKSVDPLFFWNSHLATKFIEGQHHNFVLPVMQGFVGQRTFSLNKEAEDPSQVISGAAEAPEEVIEVADSVGKDSNDSSHSQYLLTLISRRSIERPGLRYLRRGVDEEGHTANSVETEQILSKATWAPSEKSYSFVQIRGSIPLFFSQSPYAFKPVPVLQHSTAVNEAAFRQHFKMLVNRYGQIQIVLLVDKQGGEAEIGRRYEQTTIKYNEDQKSELDKLQFEWFDFHNICRGMKFENVSILLDAIGDTIAKYGKTVVVDGDIQTKQEGVLRTNCMDCLDRTNVVQSACGQQALEEQLKSDGFSLDLKTDVSTQWFNTLWADNGDAISKQYSSTSALKGDYTRTRRRNYRGAIADIGLSITRYYNNIVNDYFSQASIDFLLGNVTSQVFEDFEDKMMSGDPGMSMQKVRESAINTSTKIVIEDSSEELVGGWTILSPHEPNTVKSLPLEEVVLLLTDAALYKVCFDWNNEKVASFEKVELRGIIGIMKGTYITSTLASAQTDERRNVGFVVKYRPGKQDIARVNTRTMSSALDNLEGEEAKNKEAATNLSKKHDTSSPLKLLSFKALPARSTLAAEHQETHHVSEADLISSICGDIERSAVAVGGRETDLIEDEDIISLQEARKNTGLVEQWGHSLKRMVWG